MTDSMEAKKEEGKLSADPPVVEAQSVADEDGRVIDFKTLEWWQAGMILIAETVSLGILSLPSTVATLGLAPGIIVMAFMAALSTYSGLVMGEFRQKYPWVMNFGDAGEVMGRAIGMARFFQEFLGWAQTLFQIFVMGSHILTWTICLNTLTDSSTCTIIWAVVGLFVFAILCLPRTFKAASYMSIASFLSIFTAVMMTLVDVAIHKPIGTASVDVARKLPFPTAFLAVTNISVAFSGHSCFFSVMSELKKPEDWPKALALLQICDTTLYVIAAVVIYVSVGPNVPSPALSAAGSDVMRKAIWGVAIPTIVIAGVIYGHVAAEYIFVRVFRGSKHAERRTFVSTAGWVAITFGIWVVAFVFAESIPVFNSMLGFAAALFASWFSWGIPGVLWLFMHKGEYFRDGKTSVAFGANVVLFLSGLAICVLGLWSSADAISSDQGTGAWSCKSNAI